MSTNGWFVLYMAVAVAIYYGLGALGGDVSFGAILGGLALSLAVQVAHPDKKKDR